MGKNLSEPLTVQSLLALAISLLALGLSAYSMGITSSLVSTSTPTTTTTSPSTSTELTGLAPAGLRGSWIGSEALLSVSGSGLVKAEPDLVRLLLAVESQAPSAQEAAEENAERMGEVIEALKGMGLSDERLRTTSFRIVPIYRYDRVREEQVLTGYKAVNELMVELPLPAPIGRVLDGVVRAGADRVSGPTFTLSDTSAKELKEEAIRRAVEEALRKAELAAELNGVKIAGVKSIELLEASFMPVKGRFEAAGEKGIETPIIPGEVEVRASVRVVYRLEG